MARTTTQINNQILDALVGNFAAIGITVDPTKWSKRNMIRVFAFSFATCTAFLEQLMDVLKASIENTASKSASSSALWVQDKMFKFQYDATTPQIIQLINTLPVYPVIDTTKYIITACSVKSNTSNEVVIKVATGNPFTSLSSPQLSSAQGYINLIGTAGIVYTVISLNSDKIYVNADIFYQGQYASVISDNVIAAINLFLQNLSVTNFDGSLKMTDLEATIRNVPGVNDVVLKNVRGRANTDLYAAGIDLVLNTATVQRSWNTIAGYVAAETTSGKTFTDSLNFIAE